MLWQPSVSRDLCERLCSLSKRVAEAEMSECIAANIRDRFVKLVDEWTCNPHIPMTTLNPALVAVQLVRH
jgi:hypothetical protein